MSKELKSKRVIFRLTPSQFTIAERLAEEKGMTVGEFVRLLLLNVNGALKQ